MSTFERKVTLLATLLFVVVMLFCWWYITSGTFTQRRDSGCEARECTGGACTDWAPCPADEP